METRLCAKLSGKYVLKKVARTDYKIYEEKINNCLRVVQENVSVLMGMSCQCNCHVSVNKVLRKEFLYCFERAARLNHPNNNIMEIFGEATVIGKEKMDF